MILNRKVRIYVAGPYTKPDPCINTNTAIVWGNAFMALGAVPFVPHLTHFWHTVSPKPYETWLDYDNQWIPCCDAIYRFPGESSGADKEGALAKSLGIPVFTDFEAVKSYINRWNET